MLDLGGPRDRREVEQRGDLLLFTGAPLERDLCIIGPVTAVIWAASSAEDTDFTATLLDVFPDGRAIILTDGICRVRFREAAAKWTPDDLRSGRGPYDALYDPAFKPSLLKPGTPYEFKIDMWATANMFRAGHRIRVEISSSNFPRYDRNLNTGGRVGFETAARVAEQTVYHDAHRPSRLVLPVVA
jgi:putative CocE/NonD family hydrolase